MRLYLICWLLLRWQCEKDYQIQFMQNECRKRRNPLKCIKYYRTLVEKGKDVKKMFEFQKLETEQKKNQNQNGELSKRLDLLEKKTESELRWVFSHTHACKPAYFNFWLYSHCLCKHFMRSIEFDENLS